MCPEINQNKYVICLIGVDGFIRFEIPIHFQFSQTRTTCRIELIEPNKIDWPVACIWYGKQFRQTVSQVTCPKQMVLAACDIRAFCFHLFVRVCVDSEGGNWSGMDMNMQLNKFWINCSDCVTISVRFEKKKKSICGESCVRYFSSFFCVEGNGNVCASTNIGTRMHE